MVFHYQHLQQEKHLPGLDQGKLGGWLPYPVLFMIVIAIICTILLTKTKFGRMVFAIGSNENTAFLSGIKVNMVKCKVIYVECAVVF